MANSLINNKACIIRNTFYNRSAFLQLSLDYQKLANNNNRFKTYIYVDPHPILGYTLDYDTIITSEYQRINFASNQGKKSWYSAVKHTFDNTDYEYIISIEDDIIISCDYLDICLDVIDNQILKNNNRIINLHIGAWQSPKGDKNRIIKGKNASLRSVLIYRDTFYKYIDSFYTENVGSDLPGLDLDLQKILEQNNLITIAPEMNRHGHFGVFGWSASSLKDTAYDSHTDLYNILKDICLSGEKLQKLNNSYVPHYFWDFHPDIQYSKLIYNV